MMDANKGNLLDLQDPLVKEVSYFLIPCTMQWQKKATYYRHSKKRLSSLL